MQIPNGNVSPLCYPMHAWGSSLPIPAHPKAQIPIDMKHTSPKNSPPTAHLHVPRSPCEHVVRIRSHGSNTTRNSGEFPRYVYLLVIRFPETPDFLMFSISGKLRNSDVSDFRKLRTPTFSKIFVLCNHSLFMSSPFTGDSVRSR